MSDNYRAWLKRLNDQEIELEKINQAEEDIALKARLTLLEAVLSAASKAHERWRTSAENVDDIYREMKELGAAIRAADSGRAEKCMHEMEPLAQMIEPGRPMYDVRYGRGVPVEMCKKCGHTVWSEEQRAEKGDGT